MKYQQKSFQIHLELYGKFHPYTAMNYYQIALIYDEMGEHHKAFRNAVLAHKIYSKYFGEEYQEAGRSKQLLQNIANKIKK